MGKALRVGAVSLLLSWPSTQWLVQRAATEEEGRTCMQCQLTTGVPWYATRSGADLRPAVVSLLSCIRGVLCRWGSAWVEIDANALASVNVQAAVRT